MVPVGIIGKSPFDRECGTENSVRSLIGIAGKVFLNPAAGGIFVSRRHRIPDLSEQVTGQVVDFPYLTRLERIVNPSDRTGIITSVTRQSDRLIRHGIRTVDHQHPRDCCHTDKDTP